MKRLFVLLSFVATVTVWTTQANGQTSPPILQDKHTPLFPKPVSHSGPAPIVDLETTPQTSATIAAPRLKSVDPQAQERMKRDEAYRGQLDSPIADPGEGYPAIQEMRTIVDGMQKRAIPTDEGIAIVLGDVVDAHAFVPSHRTGIYSEFSIRVKEVLKQSAAHPISANSSLDLIRHGGAVRLPSGRILDYRFNHDGYPNVGSSYLFFLSRDSENDRFGAFAIYTAYELRDNKVLMLDDDSTFEKYEGADEATFLDLVKQKVAESGKEAGSK